MTCAACAARIEKSLNRVPGVKAAVNFATETASVGYDPALADPAQLIDRGRPAPATAPAFTAIRKRTASATRRAGPPNSQR